MSNEILIEALAALKDLRAEVDAMAKRVGWSGGGARDRADAAIAKAETLLTPPTAEEEAGRLELIEEARRLYCQFSDNDIEVDDDAQLSEADDGTWVQGWLWVRNSEDESELPSAA